MSAFEKLKQLIAEAEADATAFYEKGNKAAGTRLRKAYLDIKNAAADGRNEVSELKNKDK